ncbi:DEAD/DEAH box helicase [Promicromonospora iranensis]|uniref:Superfamily II DNA/RNA helicase n=1 Tax=Promicromonospora iranensis TaxID=1105144 RepID=A0ABU2CNQ7_9MICO|nr:DEAD/DEAH box helicase [Promicromonospora iranensis]MDR7382976.1 superfamily II DNA/RNA helicase [Promicromonospora iranensis]
MTTFADLGLPAPVLRVLTDRGITSPFPIQTASLPDSLNGRDVLGRGRTGSGKTLAFALPVVTRLATSSARSVAAGQPRRGAGRPRALILAPTRELANQIDESIAPLAQALGLKTTTIFGGVAQSRQVTALSAGVDIVIACPGRLEDLLGQRHLTLEDVEITVLDEADHMADLGFLPGVKRILDRTSSRTQRLLFSATLDNGVDVIVKRYLHQPVTHSVDDAAAPPPQMTHHILAVTDKDAKKHVVHQLAQGTGRRVLFMRTKHQAKKLAKQLTAAGVPAVDLHGNLGQGARERNLAAFSSGDVRVLVATDIAARGIHVDDVELVVHVDPPAEHKAYLHRSGRTARAGSGGDVVTIMLPEERGDVRDLTRKAKITARPQDVRPGDATVTSLVGEVAPFVEYVEPAPQQQGRQGQPRKQGGRSRSGAQGTGQTRGQGAGQGAGQGGGRQGQARSQGAGQTTGQRGGGRPASGGGRTAADHFPRTDGAGAPRRRRGGRGRGAGSTNASAAS